MLRHHTERRQDIHIADPAELTHVEIDVWRLCELVEGERILKDAERRTIPGRSHIEIIRRNPAPGAGHVFDHQRRIAGNEPSHMARQKPSVSVVAPTNRGANDELNLLASIEICRFGTHRLRQQERRHHGQKSRAKKCSASKTEDHCSSPADFTLER
jgi:hypothetical protein